MTTTEIDRLAEAVGQAHAHAIAALTPDPPSLDGVSWASVHLAAVERAIYPAVLRRIPEMRHRVHVQMTVDHRLQQALWCLDRRLTGAVVFASTPIETLAGRIRPLLDEHAAGEAELLAELCPLLEDDEQEALVDKLAALTTRAPTRPHPHTPHVRFTDPVTFTLESWVDTIRNQLDSRIIHTPRRPRVARPIGKWGAYLTAQQIPVGRTTDAATTSERPRRGF